MSEFGGVRRGEIWWADLPSPRGSEPGLPGPVLVVQANEFNESRISTVIVAAISSNVRLALMPGNVEVPAGKAGLKKDSVVNVSQMLSLDRSFLVERAGRLPARLMSAVDDGIRLVLSV